MESSRASLRASCTLWALGALPLCVAASLLSLLAIVGALDLQENDVSGERVLTLPQLTFGVPWCPC
jgi:hypothetical protein